MIAVERVATARVVVIKLLRAIWPCEVVIGGVINSFEAEHGALVVPLIRVVVNHIENYFDPRPVQGLDHISEFLDMVACGF